MSNHAKTLPKDPAETEPAKSDPAPDAVTPPDPIVESIEDTGEPSPGNFA